MIDNWRVSTENVSWVTVYERENEYDSFSLFMALFIYTCCIWKIPFSIIPHFLINEQRKCITVAINTRYGNYHIFSVYLVRFMADVEVYGNVWIWNPAVKLGEIILRTSALMKLLIQHLDALLWYTYQLSASYFFMALCFWIYDRR